jgi:hypothetical protein
MRLAKAELKAREPEEGSEEKHVVTIKASSQISASNKASGKKTALSDNRAVTLIIF